MSHRARFINVGDGHLLYVEEQGDPAAPPVLVLHDGPGVGCRTADYRLLAGLPYRRIFIDQRGAGRSQPAGELSANTTLDLVADLEQVRLPLGIPGWVLLGGGWGSLLALAYARVYIESTLGLVLHGVFLGSSEEIVAATEGFQRWLAAVDRDFGKKWRRPQAIRLPVWPLPWQATSARRVVSPATCAITGAVLSACRAVAPHPRRAITLGWRSNCTTCTTANRDAFGRVCLDQIERAAPGFKNLVLHVEVRTPRELEAEVGLTEGNIFQDELTFDQLLFNRPVPGYADYRSPVRDLGICGSSTHPGGGVMGAPGRNAAAEILRDMKLPAKDMSDAYAVL